MSWLLEMLLDVLQGMVFALLALFAAALCTIFVHSVVSTVGGYFGIY